MDGVNRGDVWVTKSIPPLLCISQCPNTEPLKLTVDKINKILWIQFWRISLIELIFIGVDLEVLWKSEIFSFFFQLFSVFDLVEGWAGRAKG